jgi:phospholipid/cholesterol/gamma-HCH transport system substrate-binding protein
MSQRANPAVIGAFVFGALLLAIGAIVFFGTADLYSRKQTYVTYFEQSVSGLAVGSNVKFKGVNVGQVSKVLLALSEDQAAYVKVYYQIDANLVERFGASVDIFNREQFLEAVKRGLRAKLEFESLISGQLYLSLDFFSWDVSPPRFVAGPEDRNLFEVPPQPSDIDAILGNLTKAIGNLGNVDFLTISKDLHALLHSLQTKVDALKLEELGPALTRTANSVTDLVNGEQVKGALSSVQESFQQLNVTLEKLNRETISENLNPTLEEAKKAMTSLQLAAAELNRLLAPNSGLRYQLDSSLSQIGEAAEALKQLSEFLERHPNSIFFGRKPKTRSP